MPLVRAALIALVAGAALAACVGEIDGAGADGGDIDEEPDAEMVVIEGPAVLPHVQAYADAACDALGPCRVSTYAGHHPSADRAIDILVSDAYGQLPSDEYALGDAHAELALERQAEYGIWYVIWRQRYNDGSGWEPMEDRGSVTQNHYDHVHISFDESR